MFKSNLGSLAAYSFLPLMHPFNNIIVIVFKAISM